MDLRNLPARLTTEQVYLLGRLVENGSIVNVSGVNYLIAPVTHMEMDFLKGVRLPEFNNNILMNRAEATVVSTMTAAQHVGDEGITLEELQTRMMADLMGRISPSACETYARMFQTIIDVLGAKRRLKTINREDLLTIKQRIIDTPKWYPLRFRGLSIEQAIEKAIRRKPHFIPSGMALETP